MHTAQENWQITGRGPANYERYTVSRMFRPLGQMLVRTIPVRAGQRVLDIACGTGIVARLAAPLVAPGGVVVGVDINEEMLAEARVLSVPAPVTIQYRRGDAHALPFGDASFDIVLCQQGLQFFRDKLCAMREMHRVACDGASIGVAVFADPDPFIQALASALGRYIDRKTRDQALAPFGFEVDALRSLAAQAGMERVEVRSVWLERSVEPSQQWLLEFSAGLPYGPAIAAVAAEERAAIIREIAASLTQFWKSDHFALRAGVHLMIAQRGAT